MKKVICLICVSILLILPFTFGCSCKTNQVEQSISQIRSDVFKGKSQNYTAEAYSEEKEFPFLNDCHVGNKKTCVVIKIKDCSILNLNAKVSYSNTTYETALTYNNVSNSLTATVIVNSLPKNSLILSVISQDGEEIITLTSVKRSDTISPIKALKSVESKEKDFINSLYDNNVFKCEIYIRLLAEGDYNFYYVGFASGNGKITAYLLDACNGKIIAGKNE